MKRPEEKILLLQTVPIPQHDYKPQLQNAVNWLGERYLLAEPVRKRPEESKTYFSTVRQWHPATRH